MAELTQAQRQALAIAEANRRKAEAQAASAAPPPPSPTEELGATFKAFAKNDYDPAQVQAGVTRGQYERLPTWQKPIIAATDMADIASQAFGFRDKASAAARSAFTDKSYEEELADIRKTSQAARDRAGSAQIAGDIAPALALGGAGVTAIGRGAPAAMEGLGGVAARAAVGGGEGGVYGLLDALGNDTDVGLGTAAGVVGGAGGSVLGDVISGAMTYGPKAFNYLRASPEKKAAQQVYEMTEPVRAEAQGILESLGPEGMALDALGAKGTSAARAASNLDPNARELLEASVQGRKAGQNPRLVADIQEASGLGAGSRETVDTLKKADYKLVKPYIDQAYEAARATGADLPRTPFEDILQSPMGREAYERAGISVQNRAATAGKQAANSELARLDQMQRNLNDTAQAAFRRGEAGLGGEAADMAKAVKDLVDQSIAGPEYAAARAARKAAYKAEEAFDLGADLAKPNISLNLPGQARANELKTRVAKGYGAGMSERLLNKNNTEGALNILSSPMAKEATQAALPAEGAERVAKALKRERTFSKTEKDVLGNSTTARQLKEMIGGSAAGGLLGYLMSGDSPVSMTGGGLGIGAIALGGRHALPAIARKIATSSQKNVAPEVIKLLTQRSLISGRPIPQTVLEGLAKSQKGNLTRALVQLLRDPAKQAIGE